MILKRKPLMKNSKNKLYIIAATLMIILALGSAAISAAISSFGADDATIPLYYNGKRLSEGGYMVNLTPYVPASVVKRYGDMSKLDFDETGKKLLIDLSKQNLMMADDQTTDFIKRYGGIVYIPLKEFDGKLCIPMDVTEQFLKLSTVVTGDTIQMRRYSGTDRIARIIENDVELAAGLDSTEKGGFISLNKGEIVSIVGETDNYYKIELMDNLSGYVLKSSVKISDVDLSVVDFYAPKKDKFIQGSEKINLVWQYASSATPPPPERIDGIDILAPTWFHQIVEGNGSVQNNGDLSYTRAAHEEGYLVWATITNSMSTKGSTAYTTTVFNNSALLNQSVAQYLFYSCLYETDGINIDYEQVADSDAAGLTAFTSLLRQYTERQGLNLSIDTLVPKPWTIEYDRKALSGSVDYIAVMTYDEHYGGSPTAGSVASMPWVVDAVEKTLKEVPSRKVLLGIPLYTRVWVVDSSGKVIRNPSASMPYIQNLIIEKNITPLWLEKEKQYYISYPNGEYTDRIWIEDTRSVANRLSLVHDYNLAGAACWEYRWSMPEIWPVFNGILKQGKHLSYYE